MATIAAEPERSSKVECVTEQCCEPPLIITADAPIRSKTQPEKATSLQKFPDRVASACCYWNGYICRWTTRVKQTHRPPRTQIAAGTATHALSLNPSNPGPWLAWYAAWVSV